MPNLQGLRPEVQAALDQVRKAVEAAGGRLRVNSAFRSREDQERLYANRARNPYPVAKPGTSKHETGSALDLGVTGMTQEQLAQIASTKGLKWAGNKDRVHFDYVGGNANDFSAALAERRAALQPRQQAGGWDDVISAGYGGRVPTQAAASSGGWDDVIAAGYGEGPPQQKGILERGSDYIKNWWNSTIHGQGPHGESLHPTERILGAFAPVVDAADFAAGGFATAFTGNPQGGLIKWGVLKPFNALGAGAGELGRQLLSTEQFNPGAIGTKFVQGFNEEVSGANFITETLRGNKSLRQWIDKEGGDAWTKWADFGAGLYLGSKIPMPAAPIFKYGGKGIRLGLDRAAVGLDTLASRFEPETLGRIRAEKIATGFKELTNATPEYRKYQAVTHAESQPVSAAQQRLSRITNTVKNIGKKFSGDENATLYGDLLKFHPDPEIAARSNNPGYLPTQILLHGAEAGSEGAFFTHPNQVLDIAANLGLPVKKLAQAIEEYKGLTEESGRGMVESGLMDDKTFAANAGYWVRRFYRANLKDAGAVESLVKDMIDQGVDSTRANNLLMALQKTGESGPPEVIGKGLKTKGTRAKQYERRLNDPSLRQEFLPDYNAIDQVAGALMGQFKAAAIHRVFKQLSGDEAFSAANKIINAGKGINLKFSETPRIKAMLGRVGEQIKLHQEKMSGGLETEYNRRTKWVEDQAAATSRLENAIAEHAAKQPIRPVQPLALKNPPASASINLPSSFLDTASTKVTKQFLSKALTRGAKTVGGKVADIVQTRIDKNFVNHLETWQRENAAWRLKQSAMEVALQDAKTELTRRQTFLDETDAQVGKWFDEAERLERRHDLLKGAEPTDAHANDALTQVEEKVGIQIEDPAQRQEWFNRWKEVWQERGEDIFDTKNINPPEPPKGVPASIAEAVDQNILPAIALDDSISAPAHAYSMLDHPPGWELWESGGENRYGAMEGRWAPTVIRRFIEDAVDPGRFHKNEGVIGEAFKYFTNHFRALKLYYNPGTRLGIEVNSFWEAKATVNAAGVQFNPRAYIEGMKEYKRWAEGDGPVTPAVEAMLSGVRESGAGYMTGMRQGERSPIEPQGAVGTFKENQRKKFIEVQQYPKAGAANVLIKAGKNPAEAGMLAEQGFGARGGMGGVETHGVMQIAEGLNRYGIALFTSYPLHSINRFFQLMAHRPDVLMTYPLVRHYLLNEAGPEARQRDERGEVRGTMVPIPFFKNERGEPLWIDARNFIPHGGALDPLQFGGLGSPLRRAYDSYSLTRDLGANPELALGEGARALKNAVLPSILGSGAEALGKSLAGETRNPRTLEAETPLMALSRIANFPITDVQNATDRARFLEMETIPAREEFMNTYIDRLSEARETPQDYSRWLTGADVKEAMRGQQIAQNYLRQLLADKSINGEKAKTMIRRQVDWIVSLNKVIDEQYNLIPPPQQEDGNAEQVDEYGQAGYQQGPQQEVAGF